MNGGIIGVDGEDWSLYPVWDPTNRRTAAATAGHIARETENLYRGMPQVLPPDRAAIGENGAGDYLLLRSDGKIFIWRHETGNEEAVRLRFQPEAVAPRRRGNSPIDRVANVLSLIQSGEATAVVVDSRGSGVYVQFARVRDFVTGEAIGERNLSRLLAYRLSARIVERLPALGWQAPSNDPDSAGNWSRSWDFHQWDATACADLAVRTLVDVYGLEPSAIRAYSDRLQAPLEKSS
jgi:hypothetical protein